MNEEQNQLKIHLDVIIERDGEYWVARCLQLALVTSHCDLDTARQDMQRMCIAQVVHALDNGCIGEIFRPPDPQLAAKMLTAEVLGLQISESVQCDRRIEIQSAALPEAT